MTNSESRKPMDSVLDAADLADVLRNDRFRHFLDHIPVAIAVAELQPAERVAYANLEFERLTDQAEAEIEGQSWAAVKVAGPFADRLTEARDPDDDYLGQTEIAFEGRTLTVDLWSNVILDDDGAPLFRLLAVAEANRRDSKELSELAQRIRDKDTLLRELQHRVTNNLQMITALIRLEGRNKPSEASEDPFTRLAGRVNSLAVLYRLLCEETHGAGVDLGAYLSQIAAAVMQAHAVEGVRLDLKADSWPVSINVAMPTGLVVNELLTNALKHAFVGREGGTITLHSLVEGEGCRVTVADDGIGLEQGVDWPQKGKLAALIVRSLEENAQAKIERTSAPGKGLTVTMQFARDSAGPDAI